MGILRPDLIIGLKKNGNEIADNPRDYGKNPTDNNPSTREARKIFSK